MSRLERPADRRALGALVVTEPRVAVGRTNATLVVRAEWLRDSVAQHEDLDEAQYLLREPVAPLTVGSGASGDAHSLPHAAQ